MGSITPSAEQIRYIQLRSRWLRRDGNAGIADDLDSLLTLLASLSQELEKIKERRRHQVSEVLFDWREQDTTLQRIHGLCDGVLGADPTITSPADVAGYVERTIASLQQELETVKGERERMREVLTASRDVLASFQKQAGYLPGQQAYSTTMTQGEMDLSRAVTAITAILSEQSSALLREDKAR